MRSSGFTFDNAEIANVTSAITNGFPIGRIA